MKKFAILCGTSRGAVDIQTVNVIVKTDKVASTATAAIGQMRRGAQVEYILVLGCLSQKA